MGSSHMISFCSPLEEGRFLRRYKRFFADVDLAGQVTVAHVPNTGSLKSCLFEGAPCMVSRSNNPNRKLKATLHFVKAPTSWVGVDTSLPNRLAYAAWKEKSLWTQFPVARPEYKISRETRLDLVLAADERELARGKRLHHVEIKNVTYATGEQARFPDSVTERGQKHLRELIALNQAGHTTEILFIVQREDCREFAPADEIDPAYGALLREARSAGVSVRAFECSIDPAGKLGLGAQLPLAF